MHDVALQLKTGRRYAAQEMVLMPLLQTDRRYAAQDLENVPYATNRSQLCGFHDTKWRESRRDDLFIADSQLLESELRRSDLFYSVIKI